jgi:hypothetical protein
MLSTVIQKTERAFIQDEYIANTLRNTNKVIQAVDNALDGDPEIGKVFGFTEADQPTERSFVNIATLPPSKVEVKEKAKNNQPKVKIVKVSAKKPKSRIM